MRTERTDDTRARFTVAPAIDSKDASPPRANTARQRSHATGRVRRFFLVLSLVVVTILLAAYAGISWQLARGSIAITPMAPKIAQAIGQRLGADYRVAIGDVALHRNQRDGVYLKLSDVHVWGADDMKIASTERARVRVDGIALLRGKVVPRELELFAPSFNILYDSAGAIRVNTITPQLHVPSQLQTIDELLPLLLAHEARARDTGLWRHIDNLLLTIDGTLASLAPDATTAPLIRFGFTGGELRLIDADTHRSTTISQASLFVERRGIGKPVAVEFKARGHNTHRNWQVMAIRHPEDSDTPARLVADFMRISVADFLPLGGDTVRAIKLDVPMDGRFVVESRQGNEIVGAQLKIDAGAGALAIGNSDNMALNAAHLDFLWDNDLRAIQMNPSYLHFARHSVQVWGVIGLIANDRAEVAIETGPLEIADAAAWPWPPVHRLALRGHYILPEKTLDLDWFTARIAQAELQAAGDIRFLEQHPHIHINGSLADLSLAALKSAWPAHLQPRTRIWLGKNTRGGHIADATFALHSRLEGRGDGGEAMHHLDLSGTFRDVTLRPHEKMLPLKQVAGRLRVVDDTLALTVQSAALDVPDSGRIILTDGTLHAIDLEDEPHADLAFSAQGALPAFVRLAQREPIDAGDKIPAHARELTGAATADIRLSLPIAEDIDAADIGYDIDLHASQVASARPIAGFAIRNGRLAIRASRDALQLSGRAVINGVPAKFSKKDGQRLQALAVLDDKTRAALGYDLAPFIRGPITAHIALGAHEQDIVLDLKSAAVAIPHLGWHKDKGVDGRASFRLNASAANTVQARDLRIHMPDLQARGHVSAYGDGTISGEFSSVRLRAHDGLRIAFSKAPAGTIALDVNGAHFDARPLLRYSAIRQLAQDRRVGSGGRPVSVNARIASVSGFNHEVLRDVSLKMTFAQHGGSRFDLSASTLRGGEVAALAAPRGTDQDIQLATSDFGSLLRFCGLYRNMYGGSGQVVAHISRDTQSLAGDMMISKFQIVNEPVLKRFANRRHSRPVGITSASVNAAGARPAIPAGPRAAMQFSQATVSFTHSGNRLHVKKAVLRGPVVGGVIAGIVNTITNAIAFDGTFVPAYGINSILGKITGGGDGGLFGLNFSVSGTMGAPEIRFNPLSVIAPGFVREIFSSIGRTPPAPLPDVPNRP